MQDPAFMDTVLDFNLYFIGQKLPELYKLDADGHRTYDFRVHMNPQAVTSAREAFTGGDYLKVLSWDHPMYMSRNNNPADMVGIIKYDEEEKDPIDPKASFEAQRQKVLSFHLARHKRLLDWIQSQGAGLERRQLCRKFYEILTPISEQAPFIRANVSQMLFAVIIDWMEPIEKYCRAKDAPYADPTPLVQEFTDRVARIFERASLFDPENYKVTHLLQLAPIGKNLHGLTRDKTVFNTNLYFDLRNSSTNFNRKRGAFVLSNYFCDDLTPIAFNAPNEHAQGKHGSDAACYACHYRLDPISGFFRSLGSIGRSFEGEDTIRFDDGARIPYSQYVANWTTTDPARPLRVGFIRSDKNHALNDYGDRFSDLERIIGRSPEVRACIVKKLSRYFLGENLLLSGGTLASLIDGFEKESKINSSMALKNTIKRLLKTNSFTQRDPDPTQCYDFAPGEDPLTQPPCKISHVLRQNCVMCHSSTEDSGGLDLSRWVKIQGEWTFPHVEGQATPVSRKATLTRMQQRVSTQDPKLQMPLGKHMAPEARRDIYLWIEQELKQ